MSLSLHLFNLFPTHMDRVMPSVRKGSYWMLCPTWIECTDKQLNVNPWKCVACSDMAFWQCCSLLLYTFHNVTLHHGTCVIYMKKHGFNEAYCNCNCFAVISVIEVVRVQFYFVFISNWFCVSACVCMHACVGESVCPSFCPVHPLITER